MQPTSKRLAIAIAVGAALLLAGGPLHAQDPVIAKDELEQPWLEPIPVPFDPELEEQIQEVQGALGTIHRQMVRHKEALKTTQEASAKAKLYEELEALRNERKDLEAILNDLVEEAKASQRTAIDEATRRARWLERQQEYWDRKEELLRDRQE